MEHFTSTASKQDLFGSGFPVICTILHCGSTEALRCLALQHCSAEACSTSKSLVQPWKDPWSAPQKTSNGRQDFKEETRLMEYPLTLPSTCSLCFNLAAMGKSIAMHRFVPLRTKLIWNPVRKLIVEFFHAPPK